MCENVIFICVLLLQENPFETIVAKEVYEKVNDAKLVAIFQKLPITADRFFAARVQLNKMGLTYVYHNNNVGIIKTLG